MEFVVRHPFLALGSGAAAGGIGYGLSHHFLDFEQNAAIGAGVFTGASVIAVESFAYSLIPDFKKWAESSVAATAQATEPVAVATTQIVKGTGQAIADAGDVLGSDLLKDAGGFLGGETATFDPKTGAQISGNHELDTAEEKAALMQVIMTKSGTKENDEARAALQKAIADSHRQDDSPDASFPTNNENPPAIVPQPDAEEQDMLIDDTGFDFSKHGDPDNDAEKKAFTMLLFSANKKKAYEDYKAVVISQHTKK